MTCWRLIKGAVKFLVVLTATLWFISLFSVARAQYMPWDTVGIATGADLSIPVPADGRSRDWRTWDNERGLRWGRTEVEPSGDWRTWDNEHGLRWGRIEVEQ